MKAPHFELPGVDGKRHSPQSARGKNGLVVMFICNHCPYVKHSLERILSDSRELAKQGIGSIAIMPNDPGYNAEDSFERGAHGTLVMDANGQYTYTRTDNLGGVQDVFTYTIRDADGDITTATLTINIEDKIPEANTPPAAPVTAAESAKATVLITTGLVPTAWAAVSLSRTAIMALPSGASARRWKKRSDAPARMTSQHMARLKPAPTAGPLTAATVGIAQSRIDKNPS